MKQHMKKAIFFAALAAALYALNAPASKLLLQNAPPTMMAGFLYLGAGIGMGILGLIRSRAGQAKKEIRLAKKDLPYTLGMIALDIAAPIFLMVGLEQTTAANASLLNNFEIVATSLIAMLFFREKISRKLWIAIFLITLSSALLTVEDAGAFRFSAGSLFVLLAAICWGLENNCTRMLSNSDPLEIVVVKGLCSGAGSVIIGLVVGETFPVVRDILLILILGFVAYGLSIYFYVYAQRDIGAAKTSAYYAVAPFIGVMLSMIIFREMPGITFFIALGIMILGTWMINKDCEGE
ncbi:MAG: DMT family transporter [Clostridia bacterium]|nr:DMT family transporter [Clostridia bacterium]